MKNLIFLMFMGCTFFSYSQNAETTLKGIFKDYQSLLDCKEISKNKAMNILNTQLGAGNYSLPQNASYKVLTLKLKEEKKVLFILSGDDLYIAADLDIIIFADGDPKDEDPKDEDPAPKDGQTFPITCCGKVYRCANGDDECDCKREAPSCTEGENKLFFEKLIVQEF